MRASPHSAPARLRLASFPHFSYLPQFVAQALGSFADEGVQVEITPHRGGWPELIEAVADGRVDLIVGNIWFALQQTRRPGELLPVAHCLQQTRFVVFQNPTRPTTFAWSELAGASLLVSSEVPTPWIALREVLRQRGISFDSVRAVSGFSSRDAAEELARGGADFALLGIEDGLRHNLPEAAALAEVLGPVPWSVYLAGRAVLATEPAAYAGFRRAIDRALATLATCDSVRLAGLVSPWFAESEATAQKIIERYRALGGWPASSAVEPEHVQRWQEMLVRWGLLPAPVALEGLLDFTAGDGR